LTIRDHQDAYGLELDNYARGLGNPEIVERDDGYVDASLGPAAYFSARSDWPLHQQEALKLARGRVLDIGCGAGRHALDLQEKGLDVVGIDISPLAVEVCQRRGLRDARALSITQVDSSLGIFDTILMLGNNFGLFASRERCRWLLRRFHRLTSPQGRIIAETIDPYRTTNPDHLDYHERNRQRGRMGGQVRIRIRTGRRKTPWFDYLFVSKAELETLVEGTGWHVARYFDSLSVNYIAILEKSPAS
jgi:2-polyprenyl-3-methyl-5-hydroxy-6-metoxy-1,4-benzoquinol methylase